MRYRAFSKLGRAVRKLPRILLKNEMIDSKEICKWTNVSIDTTYKAEFDSARAQLYIYDSCRSPEMAGRKMVFDFCMFVNGHTAPVRGILVVGLLRVKFFHFVKAL